MITVFFILVSSMMQFQGKYDFCKEQKFKPVKYCEVPRKLNSIGAK